MQSNFSLIFVVQDGTQADNFDFSAINFLFSGNFRWLFVRGWMTSIVKFSALVKKIEYIFVKIWA